VLCGRGNNGGDGMMTARLLAAAGLEVTTLLLGPPEGLRGDAGTAWGELLASAVPGTVHVVELGSGGLGMAQGQCGASARN
jgi:NAD(P)H-hydrate repair Nnr-like enzyme with NAD(P)H-hydrate epimerase domain